MTLRVVPIEATRGPQHSLIIADNLEVMHALVRAGRTFPLILADPPYDTGHGRQGYQDAYEDWVGMMRPRVAAMCDLMAEDSFLAIHMDDSHDHHLRCMLDEILGPKAYVNTLVWERTRNRVNSAKFFSRQHEYVIIYRKGNPVLNPEPRTEQDKGGKFSNPDNDPRGPWRPRALISNGPGFIYEIHGPHGQVALPPPGKGWCMKESTFLRFQRLGMVWWGATSKNRKPTIRRYLNDAIDVGLKPLTILRGEDYGHSREGADHLKKIGGPHFGSAKPLRLLTWLVERMTQPGDCIFDPFAGSASLAEAVAASNSRDKGGARTTLMVQRDETCSVKHIGQAYTHSIPDMAKLRLRHVLDTYGEGYAVLAVARNE